MRHTFKWLVVTILTAEARAVMRKYKPRVIAITGSVGKTSTKDAIYAALSDEAHVRKSDKSFNSEIGIPLTILGCGNAWGNPFRWIQNIFDGLMLVIFPHEYPDWLVIEVGADRPNDIRKVAKWLPVDVAVITRLPERPVHVEYFDSPEQVIEEKAALITALRPGGSLVLYGDDARTRGLAARAEGKQAAVRTFGFNEDNDVRCEHWSLYAEENEPRRPLGMVAEVRAEKERAQVRVEGTVGPHLLIPVHAALAVGQLLGKSMADLAASATRNYVPPPGRMRLLAGIRGSVLIDDTYNSSPAAVVAALETLAGMPASRRIAALGDMLELGRFSVEEHKKLGTLAARCSTMLITVGIRARDIAQAALDAGMPESNIFQYEDSRKAGKELESVLQQGDVVLAKGSQSMRMERLIEEVMAEPDRAPELLVRQEEEWKNR